jgi:hypothetical protein
MSFLLFLAILSSYFIFYILHYGNLKYFLMNITQAIVLRAAKHVRLLRDAPPSSRYMDIIIKGAEEIKLDPLYIQNLKSIPRASVPPYLKILAKKNYLFIGFLFRQKFRTLVQGLSKISWAVYYPGYNGIPSSAFFTKKDTNTNTNSLNNRKNLILNNDIEGYDNRIQEKNIEIVGNMKITKTNSVKIESVLQSIAAIRKLVSNICLSLVILPGMILILI